MSVCVFPFMFVRLVKHTISHMSNNTHTTLIWKSEHRVVLLQGTCVCRVFGWGAWNEASRLISRFGHAGYGSKARYCGQRAKWDDGVIIFDLRHSTLQFQCRISQAFFDSLLKEANNTENV